MTAVGPANGAQPRRRAGPFGPARLLLPKGQVPVTLSGSTLVGDAIERLVDEGFAQIPVTDKTGRIVGVFTWSSFAKRVSDFRSPKIDPLEMQVREAMESPRFIDPESYIDRETDWNEVDYVLVGTADQLIGVLCTCDVLGRLNDFAEAFVLLYEIEHEVRDLIRDVYNDEELPGVLDAMMTSLNRTAMEALDELKPLLEEAASKGAVGKAIKVIRSAVSGRIKTLEDFTFAQYRVLICCEANWPRFQPVFESERERLNSDLGQINNLRNTVFHFRHPITPRDTDRLRRFLERIRNDRELYAREHRTALISS